MAIRARRRHFIRVDRFRSSGESISPASFETGGRATWPSGLFINSLFALTFSISDLDDGAGRR